MKLNHLISKKTPFKSRTKVHRAVQMIKFGIGSSRSASECKVFSWILKL